MIAVKEYDAKIDIKKRLTLRGAKYDYYRVFELSDGKIILEPRELVVPLEISEKTLSMMDTAIENIRNEKASPPLDLSSFSKT